MIVPATHDQEDNMQGKRTRACDSRGRPVPGSCPRCPTSPAGMADGRSTMHNLDADTLTEARRERDSWLAGLREGRIAAPARATFGDVFADGRTRATSRSGPAATSSTSRPSGSPLSVAYRTSPRPRSPRSCASSGAVRAVFVFADVPASSGTFAHALRRGLLTRNPIDGLAPTERPQKRAKREIARLDANRSHGSLNAGGSERWKATFGLAADGGLRLGEIRGLQWSSIDLDAGTITVSRSLLPDGTSST